MDFIDHVLRNGATRCVFSSSAAIYAPGADFAVDETSLLSPASPYARTKLITERVLQDTAAAPCADALTPLLQPDRSRPAAAYWATRSTPHPPARQASHRRRARRRVPAYR